MSRKRQLSAPDVDYEFEHHNQGHYGPLHVAVNVKCHSYPKLTGKHHDMLDVMRQADPKIEDTLRERAWQDTAENWWEWAQDLAKQKALGKVYSAGRQGGWLVLDDWKLSRIEELLEEIEDRCEHCDRVEEEHADDACLFGTTRYKPVKRLMKDTKERIDEVVAFTDEIRNSVAGVGENLQYNLEQLIEQEYEELRDTAPHPTEDLNA